MGNLLLRRVWLRCRGRMDVTHEKEEDGVVE